jgi:hypothetical protein
MATKVRQWTAGPLTAKTPDRPFDWIDDSLVADQLRKLHLKMLASLLVSMTLVAKNHAPNQYLKVRIRLPPRHQHIRS